MLQRPLKKKKRSETSRFLNDPREALPIWGFRQQIVESVRKHRTTVICGETGSGKSTQLPQFLADYLFANRIAKIVCTQPRRVAAITIAEKVATERNSALGQEVGYSIRFEDKSCSTTSIKFATDGVLLRECMTDHDLSRYDVVVLDEAHERSLQTDILMGLLKKLQNRRNDLKIVIMSATLQAELFTDYFGVRNLQ